MKSPLLFKSLNLTSFKQAPNNSYEKCYSPSGARGKILNGAKSSGLQEIVVKRKDILSLISREDVSIFCITYLKAVYDN